MSNRQYPVRVPHGPPRSHASLGALRAHAAGHARNRLLHACEAISWIGGLALQRREGPVPVFTLAGAEVQDARAGAGEQAAHLLAGQLLVDGKQPWVLARGRAMRLAWLIRFMVTSAVPTPFNTADSAAEQAGLGEAFRAGCERAWTRAADGERELTATYERFLADADRAFLRAASGKRARQAAARAAGDDVRGDDRLVEEVILRQYLMHGVTAREAARLYPLQRRVS